MREVGGGEDMAEIGRWIILVGIVLVVVGGTVVVLAKFPGAGRLPGDVVWQKGNVRFYAPFGTLILVSLVLTLLFNLIGRWMK